MNTTARSNMDIKSDALTAVHALTRTMPTAQPTREGTLTLMTRAKARIDAMERGPERDLVGWVSQWVPTSRGALMVMGAATDLEATADVILDTMMESIRG